METRVKFSECTENSGHEGYWCERGGFRGKVGMEIDNYFVLKRKQKKPSIAAIDSSRPGTLSAGEAVMEIGRRNILPLTHQYNYQVTQFWLRE